MKQTIAHLPQQNLQKSAGTEPNAPPPKELLHPKETAKLYSFRTYEPAEALRPFVSQYWIMRWDLTDQKPYIAEVIPSAYTNLTFMPEGARVTGVTTGRYTYELKGAGAIVGAMFKPGGLHAFYGKSVYGLTDTHVAAAEIFSQADATYNTRMLAATDTSATKAFDKLLCAYAPTVDANFRIVSGVLRHIESLHQPSVQDAVSYAGLSKRRIEEVFREYVGVGVKWVILRTRLIKAVQFASCTEKPRWTSVAHELGYTDQSHFINDFKRTIGKTPRQYADEIRSHAE